MKRAMVIGNAGSGKSTLALRIGKAFDLPVIHLDAEFWQPGWVEPVAAEWEKRAAELTQRPSWVMDGNYSGTFPQRMAAADTIIFLDFPTLTCLWRVTRRRLRYRNRTRPDVAPGCPEQLRFTFIKWIWDYRRRSRPKVVRALRSLAREKTVITLRGQGQVNDYLASL